MLRFFSRRKLKGRKDQRPGSGGYTRNGTYQKSFGSTSKSKNLQCNIILLDGDDNMSFEISVRFLIIFNLTHIK